MSSLTLLLLVFAVFAVFACSGTCRSIGLFEPCELFFSAEEKTHNESVAACGARNQSLIDLASEQEWDEVTADHWDSFVVEPTTNDSSLDYPKYWTDYQYCPGTLSHFKTSAQNSTCGPLKFSNVDQNFSYHGNFEYSLQVFVRRSGVRAFDLTIRGIRRINETSRYSDDDYLGRYICTSYCPVPTTAPVTAATATETEKPVGWASMWWLLVVVTVAVPIEIAAVFVYVRWTERRDPEVPGVQERRETDGNVQPEPTVDSPLLTHNEAYDEVVNELKKIITNEENSQN